MGLHRKAEQTLLTGKRESSHRSVGEPLGEGVHPAKAQKLERACWNNVVKASALQAT